MMIISAVLGSVPINVVLVENFDEELERLVPPDSKLVW